VTGIEAILTGADQGATEGIWAEAWAAATAGTMPSQNFRYTREKLGLVINSFGYRDQHHFHVHISTLERDFAACLSAGKFTTGSTRWFKSDCKVKDYHNNIVTIKSMLTYVAQSLDRVNDHIIAGAKEAASPWSFPGSAKVEEVIAVAVSAHPQQTGYYLINVINSIPEGHTHTSVGDHALLYHQN
jgi:hypothetical protein